MSWWSAPSFTVSACFEEEQVTRLQEWKAKNDNEVIVIKQKIVDWTELIAWRIRTLSEASKWEEQMMTVHEEWKKLSLDQTEKTAQYQDGCSAAVLNHRNMINDLIQCKRHYLYQATFREC